MTTVILAGAFGKMGQRIQAMIKDSDDLELVAAFSPLGAEPADFPVFTKYEDINVPADVWMDMTTPDGARANGEFALTHGYDIVIGTSGLTKEDTDRLGKLAADNGRHLLVVPNFGISAVLLMQFATKAAKYFPDAEVLEYHHEDKLDAPSGTARATAQAIAAARTGKPLAPESDAPARGERIDGVQVHAVRLPGFNASEEVIFGGPGEALTIRQDSFDRSSFMAGIALAIRSVNGLPDALTIGLDSLLK
ncbi:4-hydroxy-tetrahydrodipicolinate reductase [Lacticaseibacillus hulanensis]|uniref:4-hydroxy-tetrahydrodipicolinate reductase n=1 Tax=Lacticaseibacillus hulanensis TaxID=2493111 RepID=UPI000FD906FB|nr:4-hydroxy-tetrahydrodipicolinate reductase [Lacticaseibacillus hulanensis]